jgi:hypothetical protein
VNTVPPLPQLQDANANEMDNVSVATYDGIKCRGRIVM